jgi:hypothetical protein
VLARYGYCYLVPRQVGAHQTTKNGSSGLLATQSLSSLSEISRKRSERNAAKATWLLKIPEIVAMLESFDVPMVDRAIIERQFELRRRRTIELLNRLGGFRTGKGFPVDRRPDVGIDSSSPGRAASWRPPARLGKQARISNWPPMAFELYETVRSRRSRINICVVLMDLFGKQPIARPTKRRTLELVAACQ